MVVKELSDHPSLSDSEEIWRYLSFPELMSILNTQKLNFRQIDSFDDNFEGTLPQPNVEALKKEASKHDGMDSDRLLKIYKKHNHFTYASCWCIKDRPSSVMWRAYSDFNSGIAIKSEYKKIRDSLNKSEKTIWLAPIKYIDYLIDPISPYHSHHRYFYKNKLFSEEREFRAILRDPPVIYPEGVEKREGWNYMTFSKSEKLPYVDIDNINQHDISPNKKVKIEVENVIDCVYLSPGSKEWKKQTLEDVISKMGFDIPVEIADRQPIH